MVIQKITTYNYQILDFVIRSLIDIIFVCGNVFSYIYYNFAPKYNFDESQRASMYM